MKEEMKQAALAAFRQYYQSQYGLMNLSDEEIRAGAIGLVYDFWVYAWELATKAAYERAAQIVETHHVVHGDHYAAYGAPSDDAEDLAQALRLQK